MSYTEELGKRAKAAEAAAISASTSQKNDALAAISKALIANKDLIIAENAKDIANARLMVCRKPSRTDSFSTKSVSRTSQRAFTILSISPILSERSSATATVQTACR